MRSDRIRELIGATVRGQAGSADAIVVERLAKRYSNGTEAVRGISFACASGEVFGILGPNGAGQVDHDRHARHAGAPDRRPRDGRRLRRRRASRREVRRRIGFAMQEVGVDDLATGRELLVLHGRLHGLSRREAARRAALLLELVGLGEARRPAHGRVLGRHAAARRPGVRADPPAAGRVPGRADRGAGPARPHRDLGRARAAATRRSA